MNNKIRDAKDIENWVWNSSTGEIVNALVELKEERDQLDKKLQSTESELSTLRAELDNAGLQIKFRDGLIESKDEYIALMEAEFDKLKEQVIDEKLLNFLNGTGKIYGCSFGEAPFGKGQYWWRAYLPKSGVAYPVPPQQVPNNLCAKLKIVSRRLDKEGLLVLRDTVNQAIDFLSPTPPSDEAK